MKYLAVYLDCAGNSFSAPLTKHAGRWTLLTTTGPREVSFYIHGNDLAGGFATFQDFRLDDVPEGLRGCDFIELRKRMYETLPWPQKPATSPTPIPQAEPSRVHLEERLPGESRLGQLQRSVGRKELQARANRQHELQEQVSQAPTARQIAAAAEVRRLNNVHARQMKPRGGGGGFGEGFVG